LTFIGNSKKDMDWRFTWVTERWPKAEKVALGSERRDKQ